MVAGGEIIMNIAIFFDGTWNTIEDKTNVWKLKQDLAADKVNVIGHYIEGLGTTPGMKYPGGALAIDFSMPIVDAYKWLTKKILNAENRQDIKLYLFGFSRGAYLAHTFSWLLEKCGIPGDRLDCERIAKEFLKHRIIKSSNVVKSPRVKMLGLWDVVSSQDDAYQNYYDGKRAPIVKRIYHAMSANEKRPRFPVMKYNAGRNVIQFWFSGDHSDVGGGHADDRRLSDIALEWMKWNAGREGLPFKTAGRKTAQYDFKNLSIHDKAPKKEPNRKYGRGDKFHDSLVKRIKSPDSQGYKPQILNLPKRIVQIVEHYEAV